MRTRIGATLGIGPIFLALVLLAGVSGAEDEAAIIAEPIGEEAYHALAQFFDYDKGLPLDARVVDKKETAAYVREKIVFSGADGERVPGYLAVPVSGTEPYPIVPLLHGFTDSKEGWWKDDSYGKGGLVSSGLLEKGFAILTLDARRHGERLWRNDYKSPWGMIEEGRWVDYRDLLIGTVIDYRRALDYLSTRADIDPSRVGVLGYSSGGTMAMQLAAVDDRIHVVSVCVTSAYGYSSLKSLHKDLTTPEISSRLLSLPVRTQAISEQNYAAAIGSRPFLLLVGSRDSWYSIAEARMFLDLIPGPTKEIQVYDSGHRLPAEYAARASEWFRKHLE